MNTVRGDLEESDSSERRAFFLLKQKGTFIYFFIMNQFSKFLLFLIGVAGFLFCIFFFAIDWPAIILVLLLLLFLL